MPSSEWRFTPDSSRSALRNRPDQRSFVRGACVMKVVLAGGTGFLGRTLRSQLASRGHDVVVLTRAASARDAIGRTVSWQPDEPAPTGGAPWAAEVDGADAVINLSGEG